MKSFRWLEHTPSLFRKSARIPEQDVVVDRQEAVVARPADQPVIPPRPVRSSPPPRPQTTSRRAVPSGVTRLLVLITVQPVFRTLRGSARRDSRPAWTVTSRFRTKSGR
jgi:hypothetical protein